MDNIFLVGGSPSSGSTLLVRLLDSQQGIKCLPETGLFANGQHLISNDIECQEGGNHRGIDLSSSLPWLDTAAKLSDSIGIPVEIFHKLFSVSANSFEITKKLFPQYQNVNLVEKTPENIFAFQTYLSLSARNKVVITTRDYVSVTQSLYRRGFSVAESLLIWFSHSYESALLIRDFPNQVYQCSYEGLTENPSTTIEEIIGFWGVDKHQEVKPQSITHEKNNSKFVNHSDEMVKFLLDYSSWGLSGSSWTKSPSSKIKQTVPVNLIGLQLEILLNKIAFQTKYDGLVTIREIEEFLQGQVETVPSCPNRLGKPLRITSESTYIDNLCAAYQPHIIKNS